MYNNSLSKNVWSSSKKKLSLLLEKALLKKYQTEPVYPPIFILGLPRSGTTLLYQYMVHRLNVSYFMNGTDRYPYAPVLNTYLRYKWYGGYISDYNSNYGRVPGLNAPHEAGNFWGRFFGFQKYIAYSDITLKNQTVLRKSIAAMEQIFAQCAFVNKNVKHLLRIDALANIFPEAHFIIIHRDLKDVALSLLRGRYKNLGRADRWWSVRPPNWKELDGMEPAKQIANQLISLKKKLQNDLEEINASRIYHIEYKDFCWNPEALTTEISHRINIDKSNTKIMSHFEESLNTPRNREEELLINYVR